MVETARALKDTLKPFRVPLLINDRVDVALAAGADGVHVGQDDMAVEDARRLLGPDAIIGLSIKTVAQAEAAPIELLDYVGIGGVFATSSKDNPDPPIGVGGLARIAGVFRRARAGVPAVRHRRHRREQCRGGDRGRRRRRRGDLGALAGDGPGA